MKGRMEWKEGWNGMDGGMEWNGRRGGIEGGMEWKKGWNEKRNRTEGRRY